MGGQWVEGVGMWGGPGGMEGKGGSGGSSGMGMWDEAVKNQTGLRGNSNNNMGLKNSRSSPSLTYVTSDSKTKKVLDFIRNVYKASLSSDYCYKYEYNKSYSYL